MTNVIPVPLAKYATWESVTGEIERWAYVVLIVQKHRKLVLTAFILAVVSQF